MLINIGIHLPPPPPTPDRGMLALRLHIDLLGAVADLTDALEDLPSTHTLRHVDLFDDEHLINGANYIARACSRLSRLIGRADADKFSADTWLDFKTAEKLEGLIDAVLVECVRHGRG